MVASEQHLYQTIILPRKLITGSIHDYLLCYCPLVGILFEVLRIARASFRYVYTYSLLYRHFTLTAIRQLMDKCYLKKVLCTT